MTEPLTRVAERFALGGVLSGERITLGLSNDNWKLTTISGAYAVKQLRDATPEAVRRQHRILPRLAALGLPVPLPRCTPGGDTLARVDGNFYAVSPWLPGAHRRGVTLDLDTCAHLGDLLARVHEGLARVLPPAPPPPPASSTDETPAVAATRAKLDRFAGLARRGPEPFDDFAAAEMAWRTGLLDRVAARRPADDARPRLTGWTHGDVQHFNLLFTGDIVTAVLDWDRLGVRALALEVVRSATILFTGPVTGGERPIDLDRVAAFVRSYRRRITVSDEDLADAARRRWWRQVCATWPLRMHYDENNPSCDHLFVEIGQVLRWWTEHDAELTAAVTAR